MRACSMHMQVAKPGLEIEANLTGADLSTYICPWSTQLSYGFMTILCAHTAGPLLRKFLCARTPRVEQRACIVRRAARAMAAGDQVS